MEPVLEGWLRKSPSETSLHSKWKFFRAKWRRRYFVLYAPPLRHQHNHDSPHSTALLEYYSGPSRRRKRGTVDLEHCEEVISELESATYRHVFALRTRSGHHEKTYLIAAKTDDSMNQWVTTICRLLGMQDNNEDKRQSDSEPCEPQINHNHHRTLPACRASRPTFIWAETKSLSNESTMPRTESYRRVTPSSWSSDSSLLSLIPPSPLSLTTVVCCTDISPLSPTTVVCREDSVAMRYDTPRHTYKDESSRVLYQVPPVAATLRTPEAPAYDSPRSPVTSWSSDLYSSPSRVVYTCPVKYRCQGDGGDGHLLAVSPPPVNHYPTVATHYVSLQATHSVNNIITSVSDDPPIVSASKMTATDDMSENTGPGLAGHTEHTGVTGHTGWSPSSTNENVRLTQRTRSFRRSADIASHKTTLSVRAKKTSDESLYTADSIATFTV